MTRLGHLVDSLAQFGRRQRLRWLFGIPVPADCNLGRNVSISGEVRIGAGVTIGDGVLIAGKIALGAGCYVGRHSEIQGDVALGERCVVATFAVLSAAPGASIRVGVDTYINSYNVLGANAGLEIGDHCIFAAFVRITDATHGIDDLTVATKHAPISASAVKIGDNVWLGGGVMVTMGSTIGRDAVVGAHSLVRGALPERSVSFGTPAVVHRIRE